MINAYLAANTVDPVNQAPQIVWNVRRALCSWMVVVAATTVVILIQLHHSAKLATIPVQHALRLASVRPALKDSASAITSALLALLMNM